MAYYRGQIAEPKGASPGWRYVLCGRNEELLPKQAQIV